MIPIPPATLGNIAAFILILVGLTFLGHGFRWGFVEEVIEGAAALVFAWMIIA